MASDVVSQTPGPSVALSLSLKNEDGHETPAEEGVLRTGLPTVLNTRDLTALMLLIVLFIANTNGVQFAGPAAFVYWALGLVTFLIPCALVTRWLATCFPGQGTPYQWALAILGTRWGFFFAFCAWLPGVLAVVSAIESGIIFIQYLAPTWFTTPAEQGLAIVLILLIPTTLACLPLRLLKHLLLLVALLYFSVFALLGVAGAWWLANGHAAAVALNVPASWQPTSGNFAVYGLVILALLGVNIPIFLSGELRGGNRSVRRVTAYVWWGTALAILAYLSGTFGIMVIVPVEQAGAMAANVQAIQMVFGPLVGTVVDIVLAVSQVALTIAYILMFSRLLVIVAQHRRLPASLTHMNRFGVPGLSILVQAGAVALVTLLSLVVVPAFFGTLIRPNDLAFAIYNVLQAGTTVVWVCSIIQIFALGLRLLYLRRHPAEISKGKRMLLLTMSLVGIGASLIGIWATISSSWLPSIIPNQRWAMLVLGVTLVALAVGALCSELPRVYALLSEQRRLNELEIVLRAQLQSSYDEQQTLLAEVERLYQEQARAALTDAITGLPNHRAVMKRIDEELSRCRRTENSCAVLFIDLDHFKRINDTWGHQAGDTILHEVGQRLLTTLRLHDFVGRYGGEEFAIVLAESDLYGASQVAERLRDAVASLPCSWKAEESKDAVNIPVTTSIGVAVYAIHGSTREELLQQADSAMYRAKHSGRNCVRLADGQVDEAEAIAMIELPSTVAERDIPTVQALTDFATNQESSEHIIAGQELLRT